MRNAWRTHRDGPIIGIARMHEIGEWVVIGDYMLRKETVEQRDVFSYNIHDEINNVFANTTFYRMPDGNYEIRQLRNKVSYPRKK